MRDDDIVLSDLFKVIWLKKIPILLILLISIVISLFYINQLPQVYEIKLNIKKGKNSELTKFLPLNGFLKEYIGQEIQPSQSIMESNIYQKFFLKMFLEELMDYQEIISVLQNNNYIKNKISQLNDIDKQNALYGYAKSVSIERKDQKSDDHILKIFWHDAERGKKILNEALLLVGNNVKDSLVYELSSFFEVKKYRQISEDLNQIDYLLEQSAIAKELNFAKNQISSINLSDADILFEVKNSSFDRTDPKARSSFPYYLRGYEAIEVEINLIRNRKYRDLDYIEKEINTLNNYSIINWVDYNMYLAEAKSLKKSTKILISSIMFGLVIGLFYAFISNSLSLKKARK